jgi:hypothetical protein
MQQPIPPQKSPIVVNGIPVLPVDKTAAKSTSDIQVKLFKSSSNLSRDQKSRITRIINRFDVEVKPNTSVSADVDLKHTYDDVPHVSYTLVCGDDEFGLESRLKTVTPSAFTVLINNKLDKSRNVIVYYRITEN